MSDKENPETIASLGRSNDALKEKHLKLTEELMTSRYDSDTKDRKISTLEQRLRDHGL